MRKTEQPMRVTKIRKELEIGHTTMTKILGHLGKKGRRFAFKSEISQALTSGEYLGKAESKK